MFDEYLKRWALTPDSDPIVTPFSRLPPVRGHGAPAMLKIGSPSSIGAKLSV
jgi:streptomycin 6-kinase